MEEKMKCGTINCSCGQQFYFESVNPQVACIKCNKAHDISDYPEKVEEPTIEEVEFQEVEG